MQTWKSAGRAAGSWVNVTVLAGILLIACAGSASAVAAPSPTDSDGDGVLNSTDNCSILANPSQLDADHDGYGNFCDADLNNSGMTTTTDYTVMRTVLNKSAGWSATAAAADLDGSGTVNSADWVRLRAAMNQPPGPSGAVLASGSATVSWVPPLKRTDGSALTNLAGYRIRFGTSPSALNQTLELQSPGLTSYVMTGLAPATWYFGLVAFDVTGATSALSAIVSKKIT